MDFSLSEEHRLLRDSLRRYFTENYDAETRSNIVYDEPWGSVEVWRALAELGVQGAFLTEADGGFGGTAEDIAVVFEEIGRALCAEPLLGDLMGVQLLARFGRKKFASLIAEGKGRVALAVFEDDATCALDQIATTARRTKGSWQLSGRKTAVYGAPGADLMLVAAKHDGRLGLFLPHQPTVSPLGMVDGGMIADLNLDRTTADCLAEDAQNALEDALDLGRIALSAEAVGAMDRLIEMTITYLRQRHQFGQPLSSFQALRHRVVDMAMEARQCRSITLRAVASFGTPDQARHVAMAKNLIGRAGTKIAEEAIQLHGGIGMTWDYPGAHYAKRLVMINHQLGDHIDHAKRIAKMTRNARANH